MKFDDLMIWLMALFGGMAAMGARLALLLAGMPPEPPEASEEYRLWKHKRRWLAYQEAASLPAFAITAVIAGRVFHLSVEAIVGLSMAMGGLGLAFVLDALQTLTMQRFGLEKRDD